MSPAEVSSSTDMSYYLDEPPLSISSGLRYDVLPSRCVPSSRRCQILEAKVVPQRFCDCHTSNFCSFSTRLAIHVNGNGKRKARPRSCRRQSSRYVFRKGGKVNLPCYSHHLASITTSPGIDIRVIGSGFIASSALQRNSPSLHPRYAG